MPADDGAGRGPRKCAGTTTGSRASAAIRRSTSTSRSASSFRSCRAPTARTSSTTATILGYSNTWKLFESAVKQRPIEILYESPGRELIQDGATREILGVRAEQRGKPIHVKARKAVVLTCGGFENNQEMIRNYLPGLPYCYTSGSPYNDGDGITMAHVGRRRPVAHEQLRRAVDGAESAGVQVAVLDDSRCTTARAARRHDRRRTRTRSRFCRREVQHAARQDQGERPAGRRCRCPARCSWCSITRCSPPARCTTRSRASGWTQIIERYEWSQRQQRRARTRLDQARRHASRELAASIGLDAGALEETRQPLERATARRGKDADFGRTQDAGRRSASRRSMRSSSRPRC